MKKKLIVALDFESAELALNLLEKLDPQKCLVKVGLELFISEGWKVLDIISEKGFEIFLDLKLHDIPNTVANSVRKISNFNVTLTTVHLNGGKDLIEAATSEKGNIKILGVSILLSKIVFSCPRTTKKPAGEIEKTGGRSRKKRRLKSPTATASHALKSPVPWATGGARAGRAVWWRLAGKGKKLSLIHI